MTAISISKRSVPQCNKLVLACVVLGVILWVIGPPDDIDSTNLVALTGTHAIASSVRSGVRCDHDHDHHAHLAFTNHAKDAGKASSPARTCPCCGWSGAVFDSFDNGSGRDDAVCPHCGAVEHNRNTCAFLGANPEILDVKREEEGIRKQSNALRLLHFEPHQSSALTIDESDFQVDQIWMDDGKEDRYNDFFKGQMRSTKTVYGDLTDLKFPDNFAHGIMIFNVLQRVFDLDIAIEEIQRVLKPNAWMIIEVPMLDFAKKKTIDCEMLETDEARLKCGGSRFTHWHFAKDDFEKLLTENFDCIETSKSISYRMGMRAYDAFQLKNNGRVVPQYFCRNTKTTPP